MRKLIAAALTALATVLVAAAEAIWPVSLRDKQVIIVPSAEDCAKFHRVMGLQRRIDTGIEDRDDINDSLARYGVSFDDLSDFER